MGSTTKHPVTHAIRALRAAKIAFEPHLYKYVPRGGTKASAADLGVDEHRVIKTLVMQDENRKPLVVLMHGDREVSTKSLARQLGLKTIEPCAPEVASRHTGYLIGGTSPFGMTKKHPIYVHKTILELPRVFINGGKRGFLVEIATADLQRALAPERVDVAQA